MYPLVAIDQGTPSSVSVEQQVDRSRERPHLTEGLRVRLGVEAPQPVGVVGGHGPSCLAEHRVREQPAAHADAAVDAPDREVDAVAGERFLPRQHVVIHAVHQRAVEIEEERGPGHLPDSTGFLMWS